MTECRCGGLNGFHSMECDRGDDYLRGLRDAYLLMKRAQIVYEKNPNPHCPLAASIVDQLAAAVRTLGPIVPLTIEERAEIESQITRDAASLKENGFGAT